MSRPNENYLNRQIFSTPPPNYNLPSSSESWNFKSPPPSTYVKAVNDHTQSPGNNFKRNPPPTPGQNYSSEVPQLPTPPFNTASQYPHQYVGTHFVGNVKVAHTPPSFPLASPISAAEQRTNLIANYLALYYGNRCDGDSSTSTFSKTNVVYPATPDPYIFHTPQCLPPLPSQPPPPPPQNPPPPPHNPPPPPQNPPPSQNPPPLPPQTSPVRSPSSAPSTSQYRGPHYSPQYSHSYSKPFYNHYKRKSESEDYHKKNTKKRKKPLSQNIPLRKDWSVMDAKRALDVEKESNKRSKRQSLIIKFPDLELNRDIVSKFHPSIENVHFQQPSTARFCFVTLKDSADPERVIGQLNKIPFGQGHLVAEFKKDREEDLNIGPEDIDPLTLYVGNLAQEVTKEDMVKCYPKQKRIDIGYAKKMKYTRYAFVSFKSVEDSIDAFKHTHASQMYSKSLIVRFRRLHGTVGMPGEPKPQSSHKNDIETPSITSIDSCLDDKETEPDFQHASWDIDVSQWEVDCSVVKQERPESPFSDEEQDVKPPAQLKSRFVPGSLEVAFSLHKPKMIQIKSEKLEECEEVTIEQSIISDISHQNGSNENIDKHSNPVIKIEKEPDVILNKPTTYNILRSLNNKLGKQNKRTEQNQVEVKKEDVENSTMQSRLISDDNNVDQVKQQTAMERNFLASKKDDIQDKHTTFIHSERLTAQEKDIVNFNHNTSRNGDSHRLGSQTNKNTIESNITRSDHKTLQSSSERRDKATDRNTSNTNSGPLMSRTTSSNSKNNNPNVRPEQQKIQVSSSYTSMYDVKEKCFANKNRDPTGISEQVVEKVVPYQNTEASSPFRGKQLSRESDIKQSRIKEGYRQNGIIGERYTEQQMLQEKYQILSDKHVTNKSSGRNDNNQRVQNSTNNELRRQLPSRSNMNVNISSDFPKVGQSEQWDSQGKKETPPTRNSSQNDNFTEQMNTTIPIKKVERIRQETTSIPEKDHMSTKSSNQSTESGGRIQTTEEEQVVRGRERLDPIVESKDMQDPNELPSIWNDFSIKDEHADLTCLNQNESIINTEEVGISLKESFNTACSKQQLLLTGTNIFNDQGEEDYQPVQDNELSDWMSGTTKIKNEPMGEDQTNDGDKDDSSDDDFNFNYILSSMKNKMKKKRLD